MALQVQHEVELALPLTQFILPRWFVTLIVRIDGSTCMEGYCLFNPIYSTKMVCCTNCPSRWLCMYEVVLPLTQYSTKMVCCTNCTSRWLCNICMYEVALPLTQYQGWASVLFKRTFRSLRSFAFFIKECSVLSVLFRSL